MDFIVRFRSPAGASFARICNRNLKDEKKCRQMCPEKKLGTFNGILSRLIP
jgi:hypothetical protein